MVEAVPIAEVVPGPRRSGRVPRPTPEYVRFLARARAGLASDEDSEQEIAAIAALLDKTVIDLNTQSDPAVEFHPVDATVLDPYIPISYRDAMSCPEWRFWKVAINDEHDSIQENLTYIVGPCPPGRKPIKCKWVLDYKPGHKGAAPRYKARLVACGYAQIPNVDYYKMYSPVITHYAIRLVLALAAVMDLEMIQLDIKTAFLYGVLEEEIYMEQPEGFVIPGRESEVCRLLKCLYGLKQASRCWHQLFDEFIRLFGFIRSKYDTCLYYCYGPNGEFTILIIYVDDGLLCGNSMAVIESILEYLGTRDRRRVSSNGKNALPRGNRVTKLLNSNDSTGYRSSGEPSLCLCIEPWSTSLGSGQTNIRVPCGYHTPRDLLWRCWFGDPFSTPRIY